MPPRRAPKTDGRLASGRTHVSSDRSRSDSTQMSALIGAIENERDRLMTAESLLACVLAAIESYDGDDPDGPYYPRVLELAQEILNESLGKLDSAKLKPLIRDIVGTAA
jgi:hypothetical protein